MAVKNKRTSETGPSQHQKKLKMSLDQEFIVMQLLDSITLMRERGIEHVANKLDCVAKDIHGQFPLLFPI